MTTLPITDFENEYTITDEGHVIDLYDNEIKTSYRMNNFALNLLAVDLYKDGEFILSMSIRELVILHFFKINNDNKRVNHLDGNPDNNSPYNMEVIVNKDMFVKRYNVDKPAQIYRYGENGPYMVNQEAYDEFERKLMENKEQMDEARKVKKYYYKKETYTKKLPLKGTPEREEHDKKMKFNARIKNRLDGYKKLCDKFNILFDLNHEGLLEVYDKQNGLCYITDDKIDLMKKFCIVPIDHEKGFIKENLQIGNVGPSFRWSFNLPSVERKITNKPREEIKDKKIILRVTKNEYSEIEHKANLNGITISAYARKKIF